MTTLLSTKKHKVTGPGGALTWKDDTGLTGGQDPLFQALWPLTKPPVSLCSSSEDPSFLKVLIFNQKIGKCFEFSRSKNPFFARISALYLKNFLIIAAL